MASEAGVQKLRLDRVLANQGWGSRSEVRRLIRMGRVTVNGVVRREIALPVVPERDRITCQEQQLQYQEFLYLMLNKPAGVLSATRDPRGRTLIDLLAEPYQKRGLFPVGRLDKDSEGLILLTNDGPLAHRLLAPQKLVPKEYRVQVAGVVTAQDRQAFQEGIQLGDYRTRPAQLELVTAGDPCEVKVVIYEGKFHQIKRMFQAQGKQVLYLKRLAIGGLVLDPALKPGEYRELTEAELGKIRQV